MSSYNIRPHHGLCTAFFEGKGYSGDFVRNMANVIEMLEGDDPEIILTVGEDIICANCPNNRTHICDSSEKVVGYDNAVLEICGLFAGDVVRWSDFRDTAFDRIISAGRLPEVCGDCQWFNICGKESYSQ